MTRTPTPLEMDLDRILSALREVKYGTMLTTAPQVASEAVHDAIAALECGLDVLQDLAAMGTCTAVAEPGPRLPGSHALDCVITTHGDVQRYATCSCGLLEAGE